ncbi:MAG: RDD family protein [Deltaproteobacteria bacterium]|nr:RDD family protein [Deltaproteobacteria bacterium]
MSQCAECGQPMHRHQLTCGSCGATVPRAARHPQTFELPSHDEHEGFVLGDEPHEPFPRHPLETAESVPAARSRARPMRTVRLRAAGPAGDAAFFSRAWALVVDLIVLLIASRLLSVVATLAIRAAEAATGETELYDDILVAQLSNIGTLALVASYFVFLHAGEGQTIGKGLVGLRVLRASGEPLDLLQSVIRLVGYVFSALPFYFGFLLAAISPHRGLHDYLAGTIVVRVGREPAEGATA